MNVSIASDALNLSVNVDDDGAPYNDLMLTELCARARDLFREVMADERAVQPAQD